MDAKDLSSMTPLTQLSSPPKPPVPAPVPARGAVTRRISAKDLSAAAQPSSQQGVTNHPQAAVNRQSSVYNTFLIVHEFYLYFNN